MAGTAVTAEQVFAAIKDTKERGKPRLLLIDFFASWCQPCKRISPVVDNLSRQYKGKVSVIKVDVDALPDVAGHFEIQAMPTFKLFHDGELVGQVFGADEQQLRALIQKHLQESVIHDFIDAWLASWTGNNPASLLRFYSEDCFYSDPHVRKGLQGKEALSKYFTKLLQSNPTWEWKRSKLWFVQDAFFLKWTARIPIEKKKKNKNEGDNNNNNNKNNDDNNNNNNIIIEETGIDLIRVKMNPLHNKNKTNSNMTSQNQTGDDDRCGSPPPLFLITHNEVYFDRLNWSNLQQQKQTSARL
jgi:thioredoxin 1